MKRLPVAALLLVCDATSAQAPPDRDAYAQAFDGAMTCAALTARKAEAAADENAWRWVNRSFAFGMMAAKFYVDARQQALPNEELKAMREKYALALDELSEEQRRPFEQNCAGKYADMDALCEASGCVHDAPAAGGD